MGCTIGFTYDLKSDHASLADSPIDMLAEFDVEETIARVVQALESGGHRVERLGNAKNLLSRMPKPGVDIVFNLCEGLGSRNRESEVPTILDLFRIPYVGSDGLTLALTLDKVMAKKIFQIDGVPTPKYLVAIKGNGEMHLDGMKFPMIVKPRHEGSSKGISEDSIVNDKRSLRAQVRRTVKTYRQPALVEEFIHGGEFTVLVIGNEKPVALAPVQIRIKGDLIAGDLVYTSRRLTNDEIEYVCPAKIPRLWEKNLREEAVRAYRSVECRDFGRVDFRTDAKGRPYVLEINPLPSLSTEDVFPLIAKASGWTYDELINRIVAYGLKRYGIRKT